MFSPGRGNGRKQKISLRTLCYSFIEESKESQTVLFILMQIFLHVEHCFSVQTEAIKAKSYMGLLRGVRVRGGGP